MKKASLERYLNDIYNINMFVYGIISFEWDDAKADTNLKKHGVPFDEASTVFYDPYALVVPDDEHSLDEDRFIIVGMSIQVRTLTVCHCYKQTNEVIRIISARRASKGEEAGYWRNRHES